MLAMGGSALGEAVKSSGLLLSITHGIEELVGGLTLFQVMAIFCALMLVCATFISHTVRRGRGQRRRPAFRRLCRPRRAAPAASLAGRPASKRAPPPLAQQQPPAPHRPRR